MDAVDAAALENLDMTETQNDILLEKRFGKQLQCYGQAMNECNENSAAHAKSIKVCNAVCPLPKGYKSRTGYYKWNNCMKERKDHCLRTRQDECMRR